MQWSSYIICVWSTVCSGVWSVFPLPAGPASRKSISSKQLCFKGGPCREGDDIIACIFMTLLAHTLWSEFWGIAENMSFGGINFGEIYFGG